MSAAYPDIKLNYVSISPQLSENINEYLLLFTKLHKLLLEAIEKVANIHVVASTELLTVVDFVNRKIAEVTKGKGNSSSDTIVKFIGKFSEQIEFQAKILHNLKTSFYDCVVKPLQESVDKKKKVWETCFHYADSFVQQINNKEEDLQKRHKDYSEAASKVKPGNRKDKALQIFHDSHNTYLLRLSSVNSINNLLYTHVLPHTVNSIEINHTELNDQVRHHVKYLFATQKDTMKKLMKSVDKLDHATDKIDIVSDFKKFIKIASKNVTDKSPPLFRYTLPKVEPSKIAVIDNIASTFVINRRTQPNLQRRLAALQQQTEQLVDSIASMRAEGAEEISLQGADPALNELIEYLCICDKEANLNVLLKQMELYTPTVIDFLGPIPDNLLSEQRHNTDNSSDKANPEVPLKDGVLPHQFIEPRLMKPISCSYCGKLIAFIGKGYSCKVCKLSVHKKCATNVEFCQGPPTDVKNTLPSPDGCNEPIQTIESSTVYDLIDLESDDDYYDDDEFDDGFSDEEEYYDDLPSYNNAVQASNVQPYDRTKGILQPEKPAVLPKPNLGLNSPLVKVLPDLIATNNGIQIPSQKPVSLRATQSFSIGSTGPKKSLHYQKSFDHRTLIGEESVKPPPIIERPLSDKYASSKPAVSLKPSVNIGEKSSFKSAKPAISKKPLKDKPAFIVEKKEKPPPIKKKPSITNAKEKPPQLSQEAKQNQLPCQQQVFCVSLYDYRGDQDTDLCFVSGCKIEVREKTDHDWWYGHSNGYEGYFPSQYVLEINSDDCIMRAIYPFTKESETELDVEEGAILVLIRDEDDWIMVRSKDGEGLVPTSYVEQVGNQSIC